MAQLNKRNYGLEQQLSAARQELVSMHAARALISTAPSPLPVGLPHQSNIWAL